VIAHLPSPAPLCADQPDADGSRGLESRGLSVHVVIRKDGARAYKVRWREGERNRSRTLDRRADAVVFDLDVRRRRQLGPLAVMQLTTKGPTLGEWIRDHWVPEYASTLADSTRERYANAYKVHIEPWLDDVPLGELTVARVRAWQADEIAAGVQPGTIHKCRAVLSGILRHAAESEAIPGNPMSLVRPPRALQRDAVVPLPPITVERIRAAMLDDTPREVGASYPGQRARGRYERPAPGTEQTRRLDALIVSLLAYSGLRPGELRGLRWGDVGESTIHVQRAADNAGNVKTTKTTKRRSVRLLAPLAADLREARLAAARPPDHILILHDAQGRAWTKAIWQAWRVDRWGRACRAVGLDPVPRPYDLRHSMASLLLAEGRQQLYISRQLGCSLAVLQSTYGHLISEFEDRPRIDAEEEIEKARREVGRVPSVPRHDANGRASRR
jgi:integrase